MSAALGHPLEGEDGARVLPGVQSHGEGRYDAAEAGGRVRGDALAQDGALGGDDGGRGVVAARLDAEDEAAARMAAVPRRRRPEQAAGRRAPSPVQEKTWRH